MTSKASQKFLKSHPDQHKSLKTAIDTAMENKSKNIGIVTGPATCVPLSGDKKPVIRKKITIMKRHTVA